MLKLQSVVTYYGRILALRGISLHVDKGEIVAIVGPNGAGKTTALNTISGVVPARSGKIVFDGHDVTGCSTERLVEMGLTQVPEGRQLFPQMSVEENLDMGAPRASAAERAEQLARMFVLFPKLELLRHRQCALLSGGEQQMVAIARALMGRPRLLLLDEPSTGLAPKVISELYATLATLLDTGLTILVAEQNARAALRFARHALVFEDGRVAASGLARDLANDARVVQAYVGLASC